MILQKLTIRSFVKPNNQVAIRVRWNSKQYEVTFITGVYADKEKWDNDTHKAKRGTTHNVRNFSFTYTEINETISEFRQVIESVFETYSIANSIPTPAELKKRVNDELGREGEKVTIKSNEEKKSLSFRLIFDKFLLECGREKNWDEQAKHKYRQAYKHFTKANPRVKPDNINVEHMYKLRDWYVKGEYSNRTIKKQTNVLKVFLRYINTQDGYSVPDDVLQFTPNFKVPPKTVTALTYDELIAFAHYEFKEDKSGRLGRARDFWCFMAFTSLRISDLQRLKYSHIHNDRIQMYAKKTGERLTIPLVEEAKIILSRYKEHESDDKLVFPIPSDVKVNLAIKDAAKVAAKETGLDRIVNQIRMVGKERKDISSRFCDIISCHDARRTFVSCSLALNIPPEIVMKCTGHRSYNTMRPYIDTATESLMVEMERWDKNFYRSQIISSLDSVNEEQLREILSFIQAQLSA